MHDWHLGKIGELGLRADEKELFRLGMCQDEMVCNRESDGLFTVELQPISITRMILQRVSY